MTFVTTVLWGLPAFVAFALLLLLIRSQDRFAAVATSGWAAVLTGASLVAVATTALFVIHLPVAALIVGPAAAPVLSLAAYLLLALGLVLVVTAAVGWLPDLARLRAETSKRASAVAFAEDLLAVTEQPYILTELLTAGLSTVMQHAEAKAGLVWLVASDRVTLVLAGGKGFDKPGLKAAESIVASGQELFDRALRGNQVVTAGELSSRARLVASIPGLGAFGSVSVVPLSAGGEVIGVALLAAQETYHFTPELVRMLVGAGRVLGSAVSGQRLQRLVQKATAESEQLRQSLDFWDRTLGGRVPASLQTVLHGLAEATGSAAAFLVPRGARYVLHATRSDLIGLPMDGVWSEAVSTAESKQKALWVNPGSGGSDPRSGGGRWIVVPTPAGCVFFAPDANRSQFTPAELGRIGRAAELSLLLAPAPELPEPTQIIEQVQRLVREAGSPGALAEAAIELVGSAEAVIVWKKQQDRLVVVSTQGCDLEALTDLGIPLGQGTVGKAALAVQPLAIESGAELGRSWAEYTQADREAFAEAFGGLERPAAEYVVQIPALNLVLQLVRFTRGGWPEGTSAMVESVVRMADESGSMPLSGDGASHAGWATYANDLNNLFTGILGQAELLGRHLEEMGLPELAREGVDRIIAAAQDGGDMVRRAGKPVAESGEGGGLDRIAREVLEGRHITDDLYLLPDNRAVQVATAFEPTPRLELDPRRIQDVVWSALTSVARDRSAISLATSADERYLYLAVGTRESEAPLKGPFGDFFRAPDLSWNKILSAPELDFLRRMGGQIAADHREMPQRVVVRLPHVPAAAHGMPAHPGLHVLAIDDQEIIRDLLLNMFMGMGHRIKVSKSGEEGLRELEQDTFDLVLTDLGMPGMSGWEVAQAVKQRSPETPVVLITGWGFNFAEDQVRRAGVDYVLTKPFRLEHLTEVVEAAVRRSTHTH